MNDLIGQARVIQRLKGRNRIRKAPNDLQPLKSKTMGKQKSYEEWRGDLGQELGNSEAEEKMRAGAEEKEK